MGLNKMGRPSLKAGRAIHSLAGVLRTMPSFIVLCVVTVGEHASSSRLLWLCHHDGLSFEL